MRKLIDRAQAIKWYRWIYIAITIATFKHNTWGFASVIEGPKPAFDFVTNPLDTSSTVLFVFSSLPNMWIAAKILGWFFWGAMMAVAFDVGMFNVSRAIQDAKESRFKKMWPLWIAYLVLAFFIAFAQFYYAAHHTAPLDVVDAGIPALDPDGFLYWLLQWAIVIYPVGLPLVSFMFTAAFKIQDILNVELIGEKEESTGAIVLTTSEAIKYLKQHSIQRTSAAITKLIRDGDLVATKEGRQWKIDKASLDQHFKL